MHRRRFLTSGALLGIAGLAACQDSDHVMPPTPTETKGPFYPVQAQKDKDFDLTRIAGKDGVAKGEQVFIVGQVFDTTGTAVEDAIVDLWQANHAGRYRHPHDPNTAPLDEFFQGWAIVPSGKEGRFKFKTIIPGSYPASKNWNRPPHIHFKVSKRGYVELVTQMYFPGQDLNNKDHLLLRKNAAERKQMVATAAEKEQGLPVFNYRIVIEKA